MAYVSPSQIATWRGCQRKWAYSRQRPRTQNKYAEFGTAMHKELELWLTGQRPPDNTTLPGRTAMAGLKHLPMPGPTLEVEQRIDISYENVHYMGFADLRWYSPETRCVNTTDHKSCGSFDYCLTPEELEVDPQFLVYGLAGLLQHPDAIMARGQWNYLQRATPSKPPQARPVVAIVSAYRLRERFHEMHHAEGKAIAAAAGLPPEDFPRQGMPVHYGGTGECERYGGCPYSVECWAETEKPPDVAAILTATKALED